MRNSLIACLLLALTLNACNPATSIQTLENIVNVVKPSVDAFGPIVATACPACGVAIAAFDVAWVPIQAALDRWRLAVQVNPGLANQPPAEVLTALNALLPSLDAITAAAKGSKYQVQIDASVGLSISIIEA